MKLSVSLIFAVFTAIPAALALPEPMPAAPAPTVANSLVNGRALVKRDNAAEVEIKDLPCHECPRLDSPSCPKPYPKGANITLNCYTRDNTTVVEGDAGWAIIKNTHDWVPLVHGKYVSWEGELPYCTDDELEVPKDGPKEQ